MGKRLRVTNCEGGALGGTVTGSGLRVPGYGFKVVSLMHWGNFEFNVLSWEAGRFMESV